jgi:hypothetical protein
VDAEASQSQVWSPQAGGNPMAELNKEKRDKMDLYGPSGIRERHVDVPWWLQIVVIGLTVWGIYYLIRFWNF